MPRLLYLAVLWLALPGVLVRLWWRGRKEPAYRERVGERLGRYPARERRPVIWVHAVSLGETRAVQALVNLLRARYPDHEILITQMTATGRAAAKSLFGDGVTLAWLPYDYPFAVRAFLRHFRPVLGVLMETEVWFNLVRECRRAGIPLLLANARLSERSARRYRLAGGLARDAFGDLSLVAAQTGADADRLRATGARHVVVTGNMKFDIPAGEVAEGVVVLLRKCAQGRSVFLAASTREGEEAMILDALAADPIRDVLVVIVPRHPQRFGEVARILESKGVEFGVRSAGTARPCSVLLGDSLGELASYYAVADVAFVGGSLVPLGGQNLIEACAAGVPVLIGPHTFNFSQASEQAIQAGAAERVPDAAALREAVRRLLGDPARRAAMGRAGREFCDIHRGASARTAGLIDNLLGEAKAG